MLIEITTFRLRDDVDEVSFIEADARVQVEFFSCRPGFARRTTARGDGGEWAVVTLWWSAEEADAAAALAPSDAAVIAFAELVDAPSVSTKRFTALEG